MSVASLSHDRSATFDDQALGQPETERVPGEVQNATPRSGWIAMVIGLLMLLLPFSATFQHGGGAMDEGTLLLYPEMVHRGALPYRDFETFYGPANPYLLAAVYGVFGTHIESERTVGLIYRAVVLIALFGLTKRWGTPIAMGCMLTAGLLLLPLGVVAYAWLGAMACALSFIWVMSTPAGGSRCLAGGLLAGLALAFRADVAPAILLATCALLQAFSWRERLRFAIGAALGLTPYAALLPLVGLEEMFKNIFLYPVVRSGPGRRLPLFSAEPFLVRLFFAQVLAAVVNIVAGLMLFRTRPLERRNCAFLAVALFGAGVMPQAWQRLDLCHLLFVAFLAIGLLPLSLFIIVSRLRKNLSNIAFPVVAAALVAVVVSWLAPSLPQIVLATFREALQTTPTGSIFVQKGERSFPAGSPERVVNIGRMLDELDRQSKPGERLFVGPADLRRTNYADTFIYHLMPKLVPATYFLEMNPLSANRPNSRLTADVQSADWLVLNRAWDLWNEPNGSTVYATAAPNLVVRKEFDLCGEFGSYLLFRRKAQETPAG